MFVLIDFDHCRCIGESWCNTETERACHRHDPAVDDLHALKDLPIWLTRSIRTLFLNLLLVKYQDQVAQLGASMDYCRSWLGKTEAVELAEPNSVVLAILLLFLAPNVQMNIPHPITLVTIISSLPGRDHSTFLEQKLLWWLRLDLSLQKSNFPKMQSLISSS